MKTGKKSQFTGILLSLFLGPLGLFYSMSWKAATVLSLLGLLAYSFASELSLENVVIGVMQASSVILSILAVRTYNKRIESHATGILNAQALMEMGE